MPLNLADDTGTFEKPQVNKFNLEDDAGVFQDSDKLGLEDDVGIFTSTSSERQAHSMVGDFARGFVSGAKRIGGIGIGIMNSPIAFIWGAASEPSDIDWEKLNKKPWLKKQAILASIHTREGWKSAFRSAFKEGDWGTLYGEFHKKAYGKTIEESLPDSLKWTASTIEALANVISDPLIMSGVAKNLARFKVPKEWMGKIPDNIITQIKRLEKLDEAQKQVLQGKLLDVFKNRVNYMEAWQDMIPFTDRQAMLRDAELMRQRGKMAGPLIKEKEPLRTAPQLERSIKGEVPILPEDRGVEIIGKEKPELTKIIETTPKIGKPGVSPEGIRAGGVAGKFREEKGLPELGKFDYTANEKARIQKATQQVNEFRKKKGLPPLVTARATGGMVLGIEEDDNGNISYNIGRGMAGAVAVTLGMKFLNVGGQKKFAETLSRNPAWSKVANSIGKVKSPISFEGVWTKIDTRLFDRFAALKRITKDTYKAARVYQSYKDEAAMEFNELKESLKDVRDNEALFTHYVKAKRDISRGLRDIKNPGDVTLADAQEAVREIENFYTSTGKNVENLRKAANAWHQWTHDKILQPFKEAGLISQDAYDSIVKNNQFYATYKILDKVPDDVRKFNPGMGEWFSVSKQDLVKPLKGTTKLTENPIVSTIEKFANAKALIARNKVAGMFVDESQVKGLLRPVADNPKQFKIMQNQGLNPVMKGSWSQRDFDTIYRFVDGKAEKYITTRELADAMKQLTPWQAPRTIQAINSVFRATATTMNLAFAIGNASRDAFMAYTTVPAYKTRDILGKFQKDWAKGTWEGIKHEFLNKPSLVEDYLKSGGGFGYSGKIAGGEATEIIGTRLSKAGLFEKSRLQKAGDIIVSPLKLVEKINNVIEMAPRLGTFERAQKLGYTSKDAAFMARQATIDFNKGGVWTKAANQFTPFLNARVEARATYARALRNDTGNTLAKTFVSTVIPGAAAYAWNRTYYSDLYDDIPEYIKQNYFTMIYGSEKNEEGKRVPKYFVIAKGDVGQMAWNPIEFGLENLKKANPQEFGKFLINYLSDLSPVEFAREGEISISKAAGSLVPPAFKGPIEDWANLKFYQGTEIVPYWMGKTKPPELQYKEDTPETYKKIGENLKWSPLRIQNYMSSIFTQYGREGFSPSAMWRGLEGRIIKTTGGEKERQAWITIKDIENGYNTVRANAQKLIEDNKRSDALRLMNEWDRGLNAQIREYNKKFKGNLRDRGGLRKSYRFTIQKRRNLLSAKSQRSLIEKRLSIK